jgi:hypothetical protein
MEATAHVEGEVMTPDDIMAELIMAVNLADKEDVGTTKWLRQDGRLTVFFGDSEEEFIVTINRVEK